VQKIDERRRLWLREAQHQLISHICKWNVDYG